ncbi:MAG: heparan-alpha-glucosaminide N-acetyltransferase domain-containing protein [Prevotellaceae bacterium]|jgi:predicted acyltransferase|nr:heparan-alpha-glucosaminide N-acetyltransferase domain-containing protein [Prevotellaceae bacterium]
MIKTPQASRLLSLDVLRGITIAGMILVNNPGDWGHVYAPLRHAEWDGLTPTDLVFPFFMFIMGVSMYLSYKKFDFKFSKQTFTKLLRRSVLLFLIGLALSSFGLLCGGTGDLWGEDTGLLQKMVQAGRRFEHLRILGVLERLALVSFFGSLIVLLVRQKFIPFLIAVILAAYWILIAATNSFLPTENNIVAVIDKLILGSSHMYKLSVDGVSVTFDPEGLLSTLPCLAHVLIGFWAGKLIAEGTSNEERSRKLFVFGTLMLFAGYFLSYGFPINKSLWSSSFVLVTCGLASLLLGLLIWIIDMRGRRKWSVYFESFGVNPMFIYVIAAVLAVSIDVIGFSYQNGWISIKSFFGSVCLQTVFGDYFGSLLFAVLFNVTCWSVGHILYRKKIFIKL